MTTQRSLVILLLDPAGQTSAIAEAVRRQGHRLVVATGLDTAAIVLHTLVPDVVMVRSLTAAIDRLHRERLEAIAPEIPVRFIGDGEAREVLEASSGAN